MITISIEEFVGNLLIINDDEIEVDFVSSIETFSA